MTLHQAPNTILLSAGHAHRLALESAHRQVEDCIAAFEAIMGGEFSDLARYNATRLRLRQANMARTEAALTACRLVAATSSDESVLQELSRREYGYTRMVSEHVQRWTVSAVQADWDGYRRETRAIFEQARALIELERGLLCTALAGRAEA